MENNYRLFFGLALDVLIRPWEKLVLGQKYNEVLFLLFARDLFLILINISFTLSLRSLVPSVSIAIYGRSRRIFLRKPPLATCVKSLCDFSKSLRCST